MPCDAVRGKQSPRRQDRHPEIRHRAGDVRIRRGGVLRLRGDWSRSTPHAHQRAGAQNDTHRRQCRRDGRRHPPHRQRSRSALWYSHADRDRSLPCRCRRPVTAISVAPGTCAGRQSTSLGRPELRGPAGRSRRSGGAQVPEGGRAQRPRYRASSDERAVRPQKTRDGDPRLRQPVLDRRRYGPTPAPTRAGSHVHGASSSTLRWLG